MEKRKIGTQTDRQAGRGKDTTTLVIDISCLRGEDKAAKEASLQNMN